MLIITQTANDSKRQRGIISLGMLQRYSYDKLTWIDCINPTSDEVREIVAEANIPVDFTNDLTTMIPRSEVRAQKDALKVTLDFPIVKRTDINHPHEIKFIATKKHLVTIRFEDIEAIHRFSKEFEVSSMIKKSGRGANGAHILMSLLTELYRTMTVKLDYLESKMSDIEEEIFNQHEKEMVFEISKVSRRLISFRQTMFAHQEALSELSAEITTAFGKHFEKYVSELETEYIHLNGRLYSLTNILDDLRNTNDSLVSTKQNEIMKILTIMAFITFPLTLFTSLFGMNTITTPIVGQRGDFWLIVGIMGMVSIAFFGFFRYKRWM